MSHILDTPQIYQTITTLQESDELMRLYERISAHGRLYISSISHGELSAAIDSIADERLRDSAEVSYRQLLAHIGAGNILSFDANSARYWAKLTLLVPPGQADATAEGLMIAAMARQYKFSLVCRKYEWHSQVTDIKFEYV